MSKVYVVLRSEEDGRGGSETVVVRVFTLWENAHTFCTLHNKPLGTTMTEFSIENMELY